MRGGDAYISSVDEDEAKYEQRLIHWKEKGSKGQRPQRKRFNQRTLYRWHPHRNIEEALLEVGLHTREVHNRKLVVGSIAYEARARHLQREQEQDDQTIHSAAWNSPAFKQDYVMRTATTCRKRVTIVENWLICEREGHNVKVVKLPIKRV